MLNSLLTSPQEDKQSIREDDGTAALSDDASKHPLGAEFLNLLVSFRSINESDLISEDSPPPQPPPKVTIAPRVTGLLLLPLLQIDFPPENDLKTVVVAAEDSLRQLRLARLLFSS